MPVPPLLVRQVHVSVALLEQTGEVIEPTPLNTRLGHITIRLYGNRSSRRALQNCGMVVEHLKTRESQVLPVVGLENRTWIS